MVKLLQIQSDKPKGIDYQIEVSGVIQRVRNGRGSDPSVTQSWIKQKGYPSQYAADSVANESVHGGTDNWAYTGTLESVQSPNKDALKVKVNGSPRSVPSDPGGKQKAKEEKAKKDKEQTDTRSGTKPASPSPPSSGGSTGGGNTTDPTTGNEPDKPQQPSSGSGGGSGGGGASSPALPPSPDGSDDVAEGKLGSDQFGDVMKGDGGSEWEQKGKPPASDGEGQQTDSGNSGTGGGPSLPVDPVTLGVGGAAVAAGWYIYTNFL